MPLTDPSRPLRETIAEIDRLRAENVVLQNKLTYVTIHLAARQMTMGELPSIKDYTDRMSSEQSGLFARLIQDPDSLALDAENHVRLTLDDTLLTAP